CVGGSFNLTVTATGGTPNLNYQWQSSSNNTTWSNIQGATLNAYNALSLNATTYFRVIVSAGGTGCSNVTSNSATVTVSNGPAISAHPVGGTICSGGTFTMNVTAAGATNYQWQMSTDNTSFSNISGATSAAYTTPA